MNPTNQQFVPTDPYLDLLLEIRDSISQLRNDVVEIKQRVAAVEEHLGNNPQQPLPQQQQQHYPQQQQQHYPQQQQQHYPQQQQQQLLRQSLGTVTMPLAAYSHEEEREQRFRDSMAQHYQPPRGAPDVNSTGIIEKPAYGKDKSIGKKAILTFLKTHGNIGEESVNGMYESLLKESKTHKKALECILGEAPSVTTYRDFPPQSKRMEIAKFETNIKYMYKLPIDKCKDHWVGDYFIRNVFKTIARYVYMLSVNSFIK